MAIIFLGYLFDFFNLRSIFRHVSYFILYFPIVLIMPNSKTSISLLYLYPKMAGYVRQVYLLTREVGWGWGWWRPPEFPRCRQRRASCPGDAPLTVIHYEERANPVRLRLPTTPDSTSTDAYNCRLARRLPRRPYLLTPVRFLAPASVSRNDHLWRGATY